MSFEAKKDYLERMKEAREEEVGIGWNGKKNILHEKRVNEYFLGNRKEMSSILANQ
jgi:hypothetical protein